MAELLEEDQDQEGDEDGEETAAAGDTHGLDWTSAKYALYALVGCREDK